MTSTTERPLRPWPTRREREGGPPRTRTAPRAAHVARHAADDPDVTDRLPIVVPVQRSATSLPPAPSLPPATTSPPARWRPTSTPCPPRPAVGSSAVHEVRTRPSRNGLGVAAACLGALGVPFGLLPVTGFVAAGLGVLALAFGIAGWSRARSGSASNGGAAVTGAVLGLIALGLGVAGTVAFVRAPDRLVYDLNGLTASSPGAVAVTPSGE